MFDFKIHSIGMQHLLNNIQHTYLKNADNFILTTGNHTNIKI